MTTAALDYRNCPLTNRGGERVAVLAPGGDGAYRVLAVTDDDGTYPVAPLDVWFTVFGDIGDKHAWIYNALENECPPSRYDVLYAMLVSLPRRQVLRFARWCRARAFEHAWEAAAAWKDAAMEAARAARAAARAARAAARAARDPARGAIDVVNCAEWTAVWAARTASPGKRVLRGHAQWMDCYEHLRGMIKKEGKQHEGNKEENRDRG